MKNATYFGIISTLLILLFSLPTYGADDLLIMTEELPPFNFQESGVNQGFALETFVAVMNNAGFTTSREDVQFYPWVRAYKYVQEKPGTILFSMARTAEREDKFKWVGPVAKLVIGVFGRKEITIESASDINQYTIGTVQDGAPEQLLLKAGVSIKNMERLSHPTPNIKKLSSGRIDLFAFNIPTTKYLFKKLNIDANRFDTVYVLKEAELYIAFHKSTDDKIIKKLQEELDKFKASGDYDQLVSKYM
mgnify:CR=1 FL=1